MSDFGAIGKYKIVQEWDNSAANGAYTFAKDDTGKDYFMKMYRFPILPSEALKKLPNGMDRYNIQKRKFIAYKNHLTKMNEALKKVSISGSNLIITHDLFVYNNKLYKTTDKVEIVKNKNGKSLSIKEASLLSFESVKSIMYTVGSALQLLHKNKIVHGDIKFDNIMITRSSYSNRIIAKLIDFDSSYFEGEAFSSEETIGSSEYYSPELYEYIKIPRLVIGEIEDKLGRKLTNEELKDDKIKRKIFVRESKFKPYLTTKNDVFALGILFYQLAFGLKANEFQYNLEGKFDGPGSAYFVGARLKYPDNINKEFLQLIKSMLQKDYEKRPTIDEVLTVIKDLKEFSQKEKEYLKGQTNIVKIAHRDLTEKYNIKYINVKTNEDNKKLYQIVYTDGTKEVCNQSTQKFIEELIRKLKN